MSRPFDTESNTVWLIAASGSDGAPHRGVAAFREALSALAPALRVAVTEAPPAHATGAFVYAGLDPDVVEAWRAQRLATVFPRTPDALDADDFDAAPLEANRAALFDALGLDRDRRALPLIDLGAVRGAGRDPATSAALLDALPHVLALGVTVFGTLDRVARREESPWSMLANAYDEQVRLLDDDSSFPLPCGADFVLECASDPVELWIGCCWAWAVGSIPIAWVPDGAVLDPRLENFDLLAGTGNAIVTPQAGGADALIGALVRASQVFANRQVFAALRYGAVTTPVTWPETARYAALNCRPSSSP